MRTATIIVCFTYLCCGLPGFVLALNQPKSNSSDAFCGQFGEKGDAFNLINFVKGAGYDIEEHNVTTEDGYILSVHRIPHGRNKTDNSSRPVALLLPGIASTSAVYVVLGPRRSLAMQLADLDYDVWIGNNRGTCYSRLHESLDSSKDKKYWNFSFEELGTKDLPAIIDYVLKTTGRENVTLVGHSEGTTEAFVMLSTLPEYNNKTLLVVALAPIAYTKNIKSPIVRLAAELLIPLQLIGEALGITVVFDHDSATTTILNSGTLGGFDIRPFFLGLIGGFDNKQHDRTVQQLFAQIFPCGTSSKTLIHYGQEYHSGKFRRYDYGIIKNLIKYRTVAPPDYNVSKITAPVALYYGQNDWLATTKDVERFAEKLTNLVHKQKMAYEKFNHADFLIAKDVNVLIYNDVIKIINRYNGKEELTTSPISTTTTL